MRVQIYEYFFNRNKSLFFKFAFGKQTIMKNQNHFIKIIVFSMLFFFSMLFSKLCLAQIEVDSKISEVLIFPEGAQITREVEFIAQKGNQTIILNKLPNTIDPTTITVEPISGINILSVRHNTNYLTDLDKPKDLLKLEDSLRIYQERLNQRNALLQVYIEEEKMLLVNVNVRGDETGIQFEQLRNSVEFFRNRLTDVKNKQLDLQKDITKLNETIERINKQIQNISKAYKGPYSQINIALVSQNQGKSKIKVTYYLNGSSVANWVPYYDIRISESTKKVQLILLANIKNLTTENWENVKLILSTATTKELGNVPQLYPWYLDCFRPESKAKGYNRFANVNKKQEIMLQGEFEEVSFEAGSIIEHSKTSVEFIILNPYTIPSDGKEYQVFVKEYSFPVEFTYRTVPKLSAFAYLLAYICDWEQYNLLSAEANVYYNGKFLNKTFIDASSVKDTFELSLGQDKSIILERQLLKDFSKKKIIGNTNVVTRTFEITIRNTKSIPITIEILDQIPLSRRKEIVIEFNPKDAPNAIYNEETGSLTWKLNIAPTETQKVRFTFEVKYPKEWNILL